MRQGNTGLDRHIIHYTLALIALVVGIGTIVHYDTRLVVAYLAAPTEQKQIPVEELSVPPTNAAALMLASTTSQRVINQLTVADTIPATGKFIAADLTHMKMQLYKDGVEVAEYPIKTKGRPGTPWETPSGFYSIQTKEENHFSSIGKVYMPYSMQFYGNYFIHGWTYYPDGTPTPMTFSGGCIKLDTENAQKVFDFADVGTKVFVYDAATEPAPPTLSLDQTAPVPDISALAYLVADIDTGDVYAEQAATEARPIASVTKLMTALVSNEAISLDKKLSINEGALYNPPIPESISKKTFFVGDLLYPLLMQPGSMVADTLASYYGEHTFVRWMNMTAQAIDMNTTTYVDPSGASADNTSTPEDLYRLAAYLSNKKSFVLKITKTQEKVITAEDGISYQITNENDPIDSAPFDGGKVGHTAIADDTTVSVLSVKIAGKMRRMAVIVLGSQNQADDTKQLANWIITAAKNASSQSACSSCSVPHYRKIEI